jgi:hypothetical protein
LAEGAGASGQVIANGDFEEGLGGWSVPPSAAIDRRVFKTGQQSLKLTRAGTDGWDTASQSAPVEGGVLYRISLWAKLLDAYQSHAKVVWLDKDGNALGTVYPFTGRDGTTDWFAVSQVVTSPRGATQLSLQFLAGAGTSWYDGARIEPLPLGKPIVPQAEWPRLAQTKYGKDMMAPPMKEKVVYHDRRYDSSVGNIENLLTFLNHRGFTTLDADALKTWMRKKIKAGADRTVCILAMGCIPDTIGESKDVGCTFRRYLEAGGRIVWIGDVPLYYQSFRDRAFSLWGGAELVLGIRGAAWGDGRSPQITAAGEQWGMRRLDAPASQRPFLAETASVVFSAIPESSSVCSFFVNYNPDFPYSGFLRYGHGFDGNDAALNADLYRLALYRGKPIDVPLVAEEGKEAAAAVTLETPRRNYPRGWVIPVTMTTKAGLQADTVTLEVLDGKTVVKSTQATFGSSNAFSLETWDLASREYTLTAKLLAKGRVTGRATRKICLVAPKTGKFPIGVFGVNVPDSQFKSDLILSDLRDHLKECGVTEGEGYFGDEALKYGVRLMGKSNAFYANVLPKGEHPELQMRVSTGELPTYHYSGLGGYAPRCMGNPLNRETINKTFQSELSAYLPYPAFMKRMYVSDDAGMFGDPEQGRLACYCGYCTAEFKRLTGFDAPLALPPEAAQKKGVISDNDPWYLWMKFRSSTTYGGWNASLEEAKNRVDPEIRFGPIPAGGASPVLNPPWALNPPDTYGALGMASYYHYPVFGSCFRFLTLSAQAMMGNRDKELWVIAQGCDYGGEMNDPVAVTQMVRSEFYYLLAAGAKGITYFLYSGMTGTPAWEEFHDFSRIGTDFGPLLLSLQRAPAKVAILASYCNVSYGGGGGSGNLHRAFARAHLPVDFVADEEILAGHLTNYRVLILTGTDYLTQALCTRIAEFIGAGGVVLKDDSSEIDLPGAQLLPQDAQIVERSRTLVDPCFEIDTPDLVATEFTGHLARYLMVVNERTTTPTEGIITLNGMTGSQPYDIFAGKALQPDGQGRFALRVEPAAGTLIGIYPAAVADVSIRLPDRVTRGMKASVRIEVMGMDGSTLKSLLPIRLTLRDPRGKETEYSDSCIAQNGELDIPFSPALNDLKGKWKAEIKDLSSGLRKQVGFTVE